MWIKNEIGNYINLDHIIYFRINCKSLKNEEYELMAIDIQGVKCVVYSGYKTEAEAKEAMENIFEEAKKKAKK